MDVLTHFIVVIISQYMCVSNHYTIYLKLTQCVCQLFSIKLEKNYAYEKSTFKR